MDTDYEAWNGERYVWPPPDDWYLANDGRWWATGTGPGPATGSRPPVPADGPQAGWPEVGTVTGSRDANTFEADVRTTKSRPVGGEQASGFDPASTVTPAGNGAPLSTPNPVNTYDPPRVQNPPTGQNPINTYDPNPPTGQNPINTYDPTRVHNPSTGQNPINTYDPTRVHNPPTGQNPINTYDPTRVHNPSTGQNPINTYDGHDATMVQNRPGAYTSSAAYGVGATTAVADRTMAAPAELSPDPFGGSVLEAPDQVAGPGADKASILKRNPALVAAGVLIIVAMGIAGYLMTQSGDDGNTLQSPSDLVTTEDGATDSTAVDQSTVDPAATDDAMADDAMTDDAMSDDAMTDDAMTDDAMSDDAMTDDAMSDDAMADGEASTTTVATGEEQTAVSPEDATLIDQFRTQLEDLEITAAALSSGDLLAFGQTACGYAQNSASLDEYTNTRNEALASAQNEELGSEELSLVVDTAVTVFCADDASRLGLEAPTATPGS